MADYTDRLDALRRTRSMNGLLENGLCGSLGLQADRVDYLQDRLDYGARNSPGLLIIEEAHSSLAQLLARRHPLFAEVILGEVQQGLQRLHDGYFDTGDLNGTQQVMVKDIYSRFQSAREGSFWINRDKFVNYSVVAGPVAFTGSIPCFSYRAEYPKRWMSGAEPFWITVFFTLREAEVRLLSGASNYTDLVVSPLRDSDRTGSALYDSDRTGSALSGTLHVYHCGVRLPVSTMIELQMLDHITLRERAQLLYRVIGASAILLRPPDTYDELVSWILRVQLRHLEPYLNAGVKPSVAWQDSLLLPDGTRLPVLSELELRTMDRLAQREHALMLYSKLGAERIELGLPGLSENAVDWILRVQRMYLDPLQAPIALEDLRPPPVLRSPAKETRTVTTEFNGDRVETRTVSDRFGDEVKTTTLTDIFGDQIQETRVRDALSERVISRTRSKSPTKCLRYAPTPQALEDRFSKTSPKRTALDDLLADRLRTPPKGQFWRRSSTALR